MSVKASQIINKIENTYPLYLAEDYDNVGLLVGSIEKEIEKILVCLDITSEVVKEAISNGVDMIISHHPLIFNPLKKVTSSNYITSMVIDLIKADINVYAMHTNFDNGNNGMNDIIAKSLKLNNIQVLSRNKSIDLFKIVVFAPVAHAEVVREALLSKGAGYTGNYSHCSFNVDGKGTFLPLEGTSPFIGQKGKLEVVDEVRIETIAMQRDLSKIIGRMLEVHPYEEVAYDIYPLKNQLPAGTGRIGTLNQSMSLKSFCEFVKEKLHIPYLNVAGRMETSVNKVAVVGGAGSEFINYALELGCDTMITGDIKHHTAIDAVEKGINVIDGSHYFTEVVALPYIADFISSNFDVECKITNINTNPIRRV